MKGETWYDDHMGSKSKERCHLLSEFVVYFSGKRKTINSLEFEIYIYIYL